MQLVRLIAPLVVVVLSNACAGRQQVPSKLVLINLRPPSLADGVNDSVRAVANEYVRYLDSLRIQNSRIAVGEQRKFDIMSVTGIALGSASAVFGLFNADDKKKAQVAGVAGAGSAFLTALIAKFRHEEDAQKGRTCSKQLERILETFRYPATMSTFMERRDSIASRLDQLDCTATSTR